MNCEKIMGFLQNPRNESKFYMIMQNWQVTKPLISIHTEPRRFYLIGNRPHAKPQNLFPGRS